MALIMDGGHVIKRLGREFRRVVTAQDVQQLAELLTRKVSKARLSRLYRVFYYDAEPYRKNQTRPLGGPEIRFADTAVARQREQLLRGLDLSPDFAVRRGDVVFRGWLPSKEAMNALQTQPGTILESKDFQPNFQQQGVDMRIGLDIAALALKKLVDTVVLVTGDADMVAATRFARREGLRVGLCTLGHPTTRWELRAHADFLLRWTANSGQRRDGDAN